MMGAKIRTFAPLPDLSLEDLVPKDNSYRRLEAIIDLSFVRDLVKRSATLLRVVRASIRWSSLACSW
jgi:hypothetical protein